MKVYRSLKEFIYVIGILLIVGACDRSKEEKYSHTHASWKSHEPLAIPYKTRKQHYDKGNLVHMFSFEQGKEYSIDTFSYPYSIEGWKLIGTNVYWVDINKDSIYGPFEASHQNHSIKIDKPYANEVDKTFPGVISDFIKVIPGNYELSFDIKLQNLKSATYRLGTKIYDAVDIRLIYYDKNKIEIESKQICPIRNNYYNASFKGMGLSNFWYIDSLDWTNMYGKSNNHPFFEGDIPDETWYVKIYFGLKGSGTLWVDYVSFRYTDYNFSLKELTQYYIDSLTHKADYLIPSPKICIKKDPITYYTKKEGYNKPPVIVVPKNAKKQTLIAAELIKVSLNKVYPNTTNNKKEVLIVKEPNFGGITDHQFVFSIGKTLIYEAFKDMLALDSIVNEPEGYIIKSFSPNPKLVILAGNQPIGDYYASTTLVQLIDTTEYEIQYAEILDYPDFSTRSIQFTDEKEVQNINNKILDWLGSYKYNHFYYSPSIDSNNNKKTLNTSSLKQITNNPLLDISIVINPYKLISDSICSQHFISSKEVFSEIRSKVRTNVKGILIDLNCNDNIDNYCIGDISNKTDYPEDQHVQFLSTLNRYLPDNKFEKDLILPWHFNDDINNSMGKAEKYLHWYTSHIYNKFNIYWGGNNFLNSKIDAVDLLFYQSYLQQIPGITSHGLSPVIKHKYYDPLMHEFPGKTRVNNIFLHQDISINPDLIKSVNISKYLLTQPDNLEVSKVSTLVYADLMWNTDQFNSSVSIWKALSNLYGKQIAEEIIKFNNAYYGLYNVVVKIEHGEYNNKLIKNGDLWKQGLDIYYNKISADRSSRKLSKELFVLKKELIKRYNNILLSKTQEKDSI